MDEEIETLLVDVRASTSGFRADIEAMRGAFDASVTDGFARAGTVLERGLLSAIRRGSLGFDDLKRAALGTMDQIAAQAVSKGIGSLVSPASGGGIGGLLSGAVGALLGLPGRATGGPVAPGAAYLVGERGPEVFVPTAAGRVETGMSTGMGAAREVRVSIRVTPPKGADAPTAMRRSSRQVASAVRRALLD